MTARRVLIIDDKKDTVLTLQRLLQLLDYEVDVAFDGKSGIEKARIFRPEVVLCDIGLPGEADGYAVAHILRKSEQFRTTFLIAVTGYGSENDKQRAREAGFDLFLTKPIDAIALTKIISDRFVDTS
jgi:CheY-like chemotaxis protein